MLVSGDHSPIIPGIGAGLSHPLIAGPFEAAPNASSIWIRQGCAGVSVSTHCEGSRRLYQVGHECSRSCQAYPCGASAKKINHCRSRRGYSPESYQPRSGNAVGQLARDLEARPDICRAVSGRELWELRRFPKLNLMSAFDPLRTLGLAGEKLLIATPGGAGGA